MNDRAERAEEGERATITEEIDLLRSQQLDAAIEQTQIREKEKRDQAALDALIKCRQVGKQPGAN